MSKIFNIELIAIMFSVLGLIGAYLNAHGRILLSYQIWLGTNLFFVFYNFEINSWSQVFSNLCYFVLAVIGFKNNQGEKHDAHN